MNTCELFKTEDLDGIKLSLASRNEVDSVDELVGLIQASNLVWTIRLQGEVIAVVGVAAKTMLSDRAFLWSVTTETMSTRAVPAMRLMLKLIDKLRKKYHYLEGVVVPGCEGWVQKLGFSLGPAAEHEGRTYLPFSWSR